jgi:hypothetical protein
MPEVLDNEEIEVPEENVEETLPDLPDIEAIEKLGTQDDEVPDNAEVEEQEGTRAERRAGKHPGKSPRKLILILVVAALLLVAAIIFAVINGGGLSLPKSEKNDEESAATFIPALKEDEVDDSLIGEDGTIAIKLTSDQATLLPADITPEEWVNLYYVEVLSKNYTDAQKRLPMDRRSTLTPDQLQMQVERDPIVSITTEGSPDSKDTDTFTYIIVTLTHGSGESGVQVWAFAKTESGWVAATKADPNSPH